MKRPAPSQHFKDTLATILAYYIGAFLLIVIGFIAATLLSDSSPQCGWLDNSYSCGFWAFIRWLLPAALYFALPFYAFGMAAWLLIVLARFVTSGQRRARHG